MGLKGVISRFFKGNVKRDFDRLVNIYLLKVNLSKDFREKRVKEETFRTKYIELLDLEIIGEELEQKLTKSKNLKIDLESLRYNLAKQKRFFIQYHESDLNFILQPLSDLDFASLYTLLAEQGRLLTVEKKDLENVTTENETKIAKLKVWGLDISQNKRLVSVLINNWDLIEELNNIYNINNYRTKFKISSFSGLIRTGDDIIIIIDIARKCNKHFPFIIDILSVLSDDLIKNTKDLEEISSLIIQLVSDYMNSKADYRNWHGTLSTSLESFIKNKRDI
ncbi:MAG: hypothetical protein AABX19_04140, partial [Nanoarchaeota archaeon]